MSACQTRTSALFAACLRQPGSRVRSFLWGRLLDPAAVQGYALAWLFHVFIMLGVSHDEDELAFRAPALERCEGLVDAFLA